MNSRKDKPTESKPRNINPDEAGFTPASHKLKSREKINIDQSGLGREQGQVPADEQGSENIFTQIDPGTAGLQHQRTGSGTLQDGHRDEINGDDVRDQGDSTRDWDAENSRTGRHR